MVSDIFVAGPPPGTLSVGLVGDAGEIEVNRGLFVDSTGFAVAFLGRVSARLDDVLIRNVEPEPQEQFSIAVYALMNARLTASRLDISQSRTFGVNASDSSQVILRDIKVSEPLDLVCNDLSCGGRKYRVRRCGPR